MTAADVSVDFGKSFGTVHRAREADLSTIMYSKYSQGVDKVRQTQSTSIQEEQQEQHPAQALVSSGKEDESDDEELEQLWQRLQHPPEGTKTNPNCLLKKDLTEDLYKGLKKKKTKFGGDLKGCIRSGEFDMLLTYPLRILIRLILGE